MTGHRTLDTFLGVTSLTLMLLAFAFALVTPEDENGLPVPWWSERE